MTIMTLMMVDPGRPEEVWTTSDVPHDGSAAATASCNTCDAPLQQLAVARPANVDI